MLDEQCQDRMHVSNFVRWRWIRCDEMVAIQHDALVEAFGERFDEC